MRYFGGTVKCQILIIGMYINQLESIAAWLDVPLITGKTKVREREKLYEKFRTGEIKTLVVSKVEALFNAGSR
jgi:DNA excision repair protein ERCC-3